MDFVVGLPETIGKFNSIWMVVDKFSKSSHFILFRVDYNAQQLDKVYMNEIVRMHRVFLSVISNRDTLFTSNFWGFHLNNF